jgi:hypothetical protein
MTFLPSISIPKLPHTVNNKLTQPYIDSTLDRIIQSYGLPRDIRSGLGSPIRGIGAFLGDSARGSKLGVLFEYLGVASGDELLGMGLGSSSNFDRNRLAGGLGGGYRREVGM